MVGFLTLLIAVIAIAVTIVLWKLSKDQRDAADRFFSEQAKIIAEKNESVKKVEQRLEQLIYEYEQSLKDTALENKNEVREALDELRREKAILATSIGPSAVYSRRGDLLSDLQAQVQALLAQIVSLDSQSHHPNEDMPRR